VLAANAVSYPLPILLFSDSTNTIGDDVEVVSVQAVVQASLAATVTPSGATARAPFTRLQGTNIDCGVMRRGAP